MHALTEGALLAIRAVAAGALICAFALCGERFRPQSFAGIFAASPGIALASLLVALAAKGGADVGELARGMSIGAVAMVVSIFLAVDTVRRFGALKGSLVALGTWAAAAGSLYGLVYR